jgi:inosose dehydratase
MMENKSRRQVLKNLAAVGLLALASPRAIHASNKTATSSSKFTLACQQYPWQTYMARDGQSWDENLEASIALLAKIGLKYFEPTFESASQVSTLMPLIKKYDMKCKSIYVNSTLHDESKASRSINEALAIAEAAKTMGLEIVTTNPSPIDWNKPQDKSDEQLVVQAKALDDLGGKLKEMGLKLAYHSHNVEMRNGAREFHHMMLGTDPEKVSLCLDAHWVYRGTGNSSVALFDILAMYKLRIVSVHLRQSSKGVWTETFNQGDIDYTKMAEYLGNHKIYPHLVLEQAIEAGSPHTMDALKAHQKSVSYVTQVFTA